MEKINRSGRDRPTLRDLTIHVIPLVATKWSDLGIELLEPKHQNELNSIEGDTRNDAVTCCRKMFSKWLNTVELASWDKLIKAVRIVQLNNVANDIEQLLLQDEKISDEFSITQHKEVQQDNLELLLKDAVEKGNIINVKHIKIFLTGASAAGKTSFRRSLFREDFAEEYESTELQETKHAHVLSVMKVKNDDDDDDGDYDTKWLELTAEQQINHFRALLQLPKPAKESDDDSQNIITQDFEVPEILVDRLDKSEGLESHLEIPTPLKLITIVDTGGQPEFIDMLPAIVNCPTINFVVIDMTKKLTDPVEVHYKPKKWVSSKRDRKKHKDEVKEEKKIKVEVRHKLKEEDKVKKGDKVEVIHHKVKKNLVKKENNIEMKVQYRVKEEDETKKEDEVEVVIHYKETEDRKPICYLSYSYEHLIKLLMSVTSDSKNLPVLQKQDNSKESNADKRASRCHIIFVGTHKDKIELKDVENLNNQLDVLVGDDRKYPSVLKTPNNKILYDISNINSGNDESEEIKSIRKRVEMVAKQVPDESIPISWLILEIQVKAFCESSSKHYVTIEEFSKIANKEASVEKQYVDVVLQYFHSLGIFLYFKDVDEMKNYVIVDHQWFYTTLCKVVCLSPDSRSIYYDNEIEKCRKDGLLCKDKLLSSNWDKEIKMPIQPIINLLSQKKILAEYKNDDGEEFYYFPCILPHCQQYQDKYKYLLLEPLLIRFLSGFLPRGFFCLLIVYLLKNLPSQWSEVKTNLKYGNVITFRINKECEFYLRLQDKICYLEVEVRHHKYNHVKRDLSDELNSLQKCLHAVCDALNLDHNKLEYGFLCTGNLMDDHMVVLNSIDSPTFLKQCEKCQTENEMHHLHRLWFKSLLTKDMQPQDSGQDETQITWNHKAVNQSKQYSQTFDQPTQWSTRVEHPWSEDELKEKCTHISKAIPLTDDNIKTTVLNKVAILLVTVNNSETFAIRSYLKPLDGYIYNYHSKVLYGEQSREHAIYYIGKYGVLPAALRQIKPGSELQGGASGVPRMAYEAFPNLTTIIAVGVACGVEKKAQMYDILVSTKVATYSKARTEDGKYIPRGPTIDASSYLTELFKNPIEWISVQIKDRLKSSNIPIPKMIPGVILSGPFLIDDPELKQQFIDDFSPEAKGIEMEGTYLMEATQQSTTEVIIVKAVSDFGDGNKTKDYQPTAALLAADFVHTHFSNPCVEDMLVKHKGKRPNSPESGNCVIV